MARVRIKTKGHRPPEEHGLGERPAHGIRRKRRDPATPGTVAFALLGWLTAATLVVCAVLHARNVRDQIREMRANRSEENSEASKLCQDRIDAIDAERKVITDQYNQQIRLHEKLAYDIRGLEELIPRLESQVTQGERTQEDLLAASRTLRTDASQTTESVGALRKKLQRLQATIAEQRAEYQRLGKAMQADLLAVRDKRNARAIVHWYRTHRHTIFGPAAGVFAAERLYETKRPQDALRLYEEILRNYPNEGNPYLEHCRQRVERIGNRQPYEAADVKPMVYTPKPDAADAPADNE